MRHRTRGRGYGMGRGPGGFDDLDDFDGPGFGRGGGPGFGPGDPDRHLFTCQGYRPGRPTTQERIARLEEVRRDLEEMTADVASRIDWLRRRESEQATT